MKALSSNLNPKDNRKPLLFSFWVLIILLLFSVQTEARIYIQIDQASEKKFPIAIVDLVATEGGENREWSQKVSQILRNDLRLTGLFDVVSSDQFPNNDGALSIDPAQIQFQPWTLIGAQALVNGGYSQTKDGVKVELHLYDPFLGQHLISRTYTAKPKEISVVAHHFADEIMKELTGEEGVFSTKIAYVQSSRRTKEVGIMDMDGGNAHLITRDKTTNLSPAWSPNGSQIAYTTFTKDKSTEVCLVGSSGGTCKQVTSNGGINLSPAWSPGGVLTIASATSGDTDLFLVNQSGGILRKLASSFGIEVNPAWSPDGSSFVFASERAGKLHLFKADASGGSVERLTFVGSQNDNPAWSPQGDKIAFQSMSGGWDIFIMNSDGSMIQRLTSNGGSESPSWSPNGRFIAYSSEGRVTLMREDGSNPTPVGPGGSLQPSWSPRFK